MAYALTTVTAVKALGGIKDQLSDKPLGDLIASFTTFVDEYTGRHFDARSYPETRDGNGKDELFLRHGPIVSVESLYIGPTLIPAQPEWGQPGYFTDDKANSLFLCGYEFTKGRKNIRIAYTGGFAAIPPSISQVANELVLAAFKRGKRGIDAVSESSATGQQTFSWSQKDLPPTARAILDLYRRVA